MSCKRGYIRRRAYTRKAHIRKDGSHVKTTYVKSRCIKDRGLKGKGPRHFSLESKNVLSKHGYQNVKISRSANATSR